TLIANAALNAGTVDLFTGSVLKTGGAATWDADIRGNSGTLDVNHALTIKGSVTDLAAVDIADGVTLTIDGSDGDETLSADSILINDTAGQDAGLTLDSQANSITVESRIDSLD